MFCSSAIHSLLRSEASSSYRRAPARTLRLNTADGLSSGVFESFVIPVSIENSVDTLNQCFTVLTKLADDICLLGMSFFDTALGYIRSSTGEITSFEFSRQKRVTIFFIIISKLVILHY